MVEKLGGPICNRQAANDHCVYSEQTRFRRRRWRCLKEVLPTCPPVQRAEEVRLPRCHMAACLRTLITMARAIRGLIIGYYCWRGSCGAGGCPPRGSAEVGALRQSCALPPIAQANLSGPYEPRASVGAEVIASEGANANALARYQFENFFTPLCSRPGESRCAAALATAARENLPADPSHRGAALPDTGTVSNVSGQATSGSRGLEATAARGLARGHGISTTFLRAT